MKIKNIHISMPRKLRSGLRLLATICILAAGVHPDASAVTRNQKTSTKNANEFTVVIDAGHGGHDYGAVDNGANEKDINLSVAKKLSARIKKKMKDVKVVMTRDDDTFISLQERANIANRNKGNLFISIHTNSVDKSNPNRRSVSGASVYALGPQKDANNLKVAQRENSVIELEDNYHQKYSGFDPSKDESYIIFEMAQKKNLGQSLKFADKAQKELVATAGRNDRGVKQAGFWVLWATSMPSVLVELDFICNPDEAAFLSSNEGQEKLADALFNAFENYVNASKKSTSLTEELDHGKSLHNQQAGADIKAQSGPAEESVASNDPDKVNSLVASTPKSEKTRGYNAQNVANRSGSKARKRRSDASKIQSDNRSLETESIVLNSENQFLAVQEVEKEEVKEPVKTENNDKNKKNKKNKKKDKKGKKDNKSNKSDKKNNDLAQVPDKKNDKNSSQSNSHKKTFTVKSSSPTSSATTASSTSASNSGTVGASQQSSGAKMVYKIQLLASDTEKKYDDPAFCGLTPSGMFKENGKYKYTYGSSTNRREIEQKLLDIKSLIPEATIIVKIE